MKLKKFYPTMDKRMDPFAANLKAYLKDCSP